jgi:hypothetical protein
LMLLTKKKCIWKMFWLHLITLVGIVTSPNIFICQRKIQIVPWNNRK